MPGFLMRTTRLRKVGDDVKNWYAENLSHGYLILTDPFYRAPLDCPSEN